MPKKNHSYEKQEYLRAKEVADRLGISAQRVNKLVLDGNLSRRMTDGKFPWPRVKSQYEIYMETRQPQVIYAGEGIDSVLAKSLQEMDPNIDPDASPMEPPKKKAMDQSEFDYSNLSAVEQIIMSIQNQTKGADQASYAWSRALNEAIKARIKFLELMDMESKTLSKEEVESWLEGISRHNRDMWLNWPQLISNEISEEIGCDSDVLYGILMRFVRENLERIATLPVEFKGQHSSSLSEGTEAT